MTVAFAPNICEILSYAYSTHSQLTRAFSTRHNPWTSEDDAAEENNKKVYGPLSIPDPNSHITREQQETIYNRMGLVAAITFKKKLATC